MFFGIVSALYSPPGIWSFVSGVVEVSLIGNLNLLDDF